MPVEYVTRRRGCVWPSHGISSLKNHIFRRGTKLTEPWSPRAGDVIVSNWGSFCDLPDNIANEYISVSWVEILWLASRYAVWYSV
jgi:hypothetical protein